MTLTVAAPSKLSPDSQLSQTPRAVGSTLSSLSSLPTPIRRVPIFRSAASRYIRLSFMWRYTLLYHHSFHRLPSGLALLSP